SRRSGAEIQKDFSPSLPSADGHGRARACEFCLFWCFRVRSPNSLGPLLQGGQQCLLFFFAPIKHLRHHRCYAAGNVILNRAPAPDCDSSSILPLCSWTARNACASPMPLPCGLVV